MTPAMPSQSAAVETSATEKHAIRNRWTGEVAPLGACRLREVLSYSPETGEFRYRVSTARCIKVDAVAGRSVNSDGYKHIQIDGRTHKAHRLAWLYVYGQFPAGMLDHINGNRADNRIINLRQASRSENLANSRVFRAGKTEHKGVRRHTNGKWSARVQRDGVSRFLGYFQDQEDAVAAYRLEAVELFGSFAKVAA